MKVRTALGALASACALSAVVPGTAPAAFDTYLKIQGIDGESAAKGFEKTIEVYSFSLGGTKQTSKPTQFSSLSLMKKTDSSTPPLTQAMASGQTIPSAKLSLVKASGDGSPAAFMRYCLTGVRVESIQWSGSSGGDDTPTESVALAYNTIVLAYQREKPDGSLDPALFAGWDLVNRLQYADQSC